LNTATGGLEGWPIPNIQQIINRLWVVKPKVFGLIDFTAEYHQTPLHPNSWAHTAFITQSRLYEWRRVAMGLKGSGHFFQRSIANKVLVGYVTNIYEVYIDVLIHGDSYKIYLSNTRSKKVTANPKKTSLGLDKVEYVGHLISSEGISFTPEKRKEVLDFPLPSTEKARLQFIGLVNYFRDHIPNMTETVLPLRKLVDMKKHRGANRIEWTEDTIGFRVL